MALPVDASALLVRVQSACDLTFSYDRSQPASPVTDHAAKSTRDLPIFLTEYRSHNAEKCPVDRHFWATLTQTNRSRGIQAFGRRLNSNRPCQGGGACCLL
jgi:hypothetical protein